MQEENGAICSNVVRARMRCSHHHLTLTTTAYCPYIRFAGFRNTNTMFKSILVVLGALAAAQAVELNSANFESGIVFCVLYKIPCPRCYLWVCWSLFVCLFVPWYSWGKERADTQVKSYLYHHTITCVTCRLYRSGP